MLFQFEIASFVQINNLSLSLTKNLVKPIHQLAFNFSLDCLVNLHANKNEMTKFAIVIISKKCFKESFWPILFDCNRWMA